MKVPADEDTFHIRLTMASLLGAFVLGGSLVGWTVTDYLSDSDTQYWWAWLLCAVGGFLTFVSIVIMGIWVSEEL